MTGWTAVVPIKPTLDRKTRLRPRLGAELSIALSEAMLAHVLAMLEAAPSVGRVALLSAEAPSSGRDWLEDVGGGLNAALAGAALVVGQRLLVVHADLPALSVDDIEILLDAASGGAAIAPDRHDRGTNALALRAAENFPFAFGGNSLSRHRALLPEARIVSRPGLALDLDDADDLAHAIRLGLLPEALAG